MHINQLILVPLQHLHVEVKLLQLPLLAFLAGVHVQQVDAVRMDLAQPPHSPSEGIPTMLAQIQFQLLQTDTAWSSWHSVQGNVCELYKFPASTLDPVSACTSDFRQGRK